MLIPCIYTSHNRAATYGDPLRFRPAHFMEQKFSAAEYFPFGGETAMASASLALRDEVGFWLRSSVAIALAQWQKGRR